MNLPIYSALVGSALMTLQLALMLMVGFARSRHQVNLGDGGNEALLQAIRRHGNLTENAPLFLILLAMIEIISGSGIAVAALGGTFVVARVAHAIGLSQGSGPNAGRAVGALGTLICGVGAAGYLAYLALGAG